MKKKFMIVGRLGHLVKLSGQFRNLNRYINTLFKVVRIVVCGLCARLSCKGDVGLNPAGDTSCNTFFSSSGHLSTEQ